MIDARPTRVDALILAAGAALGLALAIVGDRAFLGVMPMLRSYHPAWRGLPDWAYELEIPAKRAAYDLTAGLVGFTPIAALATFRRPSLVRRRPAMPGGSATGAATLAILGFVAWRAGFWAAQGATFPNSFPPPLGRGWRVDDWRGIVRVATSSVVGAWACLAVGRRWRAQAGWRDALGRWLGGSWIGLATADALAPALWGWPW